jgi:hypothetical protein
MNLITNTAKLNTALTALATSAAAYDADLHLCACSVFAHLSEHRDLTMVKRLFGSVSKSTRKSLMADWFAHFMPIELAPATGGMVKFAKENSDQWAKFVEELPRILKEIQETPFWEFKKDPVTKAVTFDTVFAQLEKSLDAKGLTSDSERELIESLITAARKIRAHRDLGDDAPVASRGQSQETRPAVH